MHEREHRLSAIHHNYHRWRLKRLMGAWPCPWASRRATSPRNSRPWPRC